MQTKLSVEPLKEQREKCEGRRDGRERKIEKLSLVYLGGESRNAVNSGSSFTSVLTQCRVCAPRYRLLGTLVQLHNEVVMTISPINLIARANDERAETLGARCYELRSNERRAREYRMINQFIYSRSSRALGRENDKRANVSDARCTQTGGAKRDSVEKTRHMQQSCTTPARFYCNDMQRLLRHLHPDY